MTKSKAWQNILAAGELLTAAAKFFIDDAAADAESEGADEDTAGRRTSLTDVKKDDICAFLHADVPFEVVVKLIAPGYKQTLAKLKDTVFYRASEQWTIDVRKKKLDEAISRYPAAWEAFAAQFSTPLGSKKNKQPAAHATVNVDVDDDVDDKVDDAENHVDKRAKLSAGADVVLVPDTPPSAAAIVKRGPPPFCGFCRKPRVERSCPRCAKD